MLQTLQNAVIKFSMVVVQVKCWDVLTLNFGRVANKRLLVGDNTVI
jgi:hypothetical protein